MRRTTVTALILVPFLWSCDHEPRLDGASLFALHHSAQAMKKELKLSKADAEALDGAIDVLVGDAMRDLLARPESAGEAPSSEAQAEQEASILAPVDGLAFREVVTAAADQTNRELEDLLAQLGEHEARAAEHQKHLDRIQVVRAMYGMSLSTRRSWIDLTVHNGSDRSLSELLLDCRLVERGIAMIREQGTCAVVFPAGLAPGATGLAHTYVGWESEPRSARTVEAWPIRAYGDARATLWEVPSQLDPLEAGEIGDIKNRVAVVDDSLRTLRGVEAAGAGLDAEKN
jgi:hypothetical protein